jgi:hypothetical protein
MSESVIVPGLSFMIIYIRVLMFCYVNEKLAKLSVSAVFVTVGIYRRFALNVAEQIMFVQPTITPNLH